MMISTPAMTRSHARGLMVARVLSVLCASPLTERDVVDVICDDPPLDGVLSTITPRARHGRP